MEYIINKSFLMKKHYLVHRCISTISFLCQTVSNIEKILSFIPEIVYHLFINGYCFMDKTDCHPIEYNHCRLDGNSYIFYLENHNSIVYKKEDIINLKLNHLGISPIDGAIKHSEILNTIQEYLLSIVKNGGRPSGIFSVSQFTSDDQKTRTRESINTVLNNIGSKGLAAIVEGEYQWQNLGISPRDLQILDIHKEQCKMICTYFQIPPILMGFEDRIYNNNYKTARTQFTEDFIIPLVKYIERHIP